MGMREHRKDCHHCQASSATLPWLQLPSAALLCSRWRQGVGCTLWLLSRTALCYGRAWPVEDNRHNGCHEAQPLLPRAARGGGRFHAAHATLWRMPPTRRGGFPGMDLGRSRRARVASVPDTLPVSPCTSANHAPSTRETSHAAKRCTAMALAGSIHGPPHWSPPRERAGSDSAQYSAGAPPGWPPEDIP